MRYFIKGNYYFDIDHHNQLRVAGPENHLLLGMAFPKDTQLEVVHSYVRKKQLVIRLLIKSSQLSIPLPLVTDIRTLRHFIETNAVEPTYDQLLKQGVEEIKPKTVTAIRGRSHYGYRFTNEYVDESQEKVYGAELISLMKQKMQLVNNHLELTTKKAPIYLTIRTISSISIETGLKTLIRRKSHGFPDSLFNPFLMRIYDEAREHVEHLVKTHKTSSFEYGTIFPRDWIESADLGLGDLTQRTIDYMYKQSMAYVTEAGEGWHEDLVGEYKVKAEKAILSVDRKMIDIEPHYIIGIPFVSKRFITNPENKQKYQNISQYLLAKSENHDLITFKKKKEKEEFERVGNWRDSYDAFPGQESPLAPYDVNCVFYPTALKVMLRYHDYLGIADKDRLKKVIRKWNRQKDKYRLYHPNDIIGYSLALHGRKLRPISVPHLDESYDLFYGSPSMEESMSFAQKVMQPDYFYTPGGPILIDQEDTQLSTADYHGKVIWPKQAAYAIAGLARQYRRGQRGQWPWPVLDKLKKAVFMTAEACFKGWQDMGFVPELYYFDHNEGRARPYTDQESYRGQMSVIQLWSSIGLRRIMREYAALMEEK